MLYLGPTSSLSPSALSIYTPTLRFVSNSLIFRHQFSPYRYPSQTNTPPEPSLPAPLSLPWELADLREVTSPEVEPELEEDCNKWVVLSLYEAFNSRDVDTVHRLLKPDLEWWFHGPPSHQHMMRVLTGQRDRFVFVPTYVTAFGSIVLVEGTDPRSKSVFWVHAWTVGPDGIITQLREYFNTYLTVTRLPPPPSSSSNSESSCVPLWQSRIRVGGSAGKTVPGLVLAI